MPAQRRTRSKTRAERKGEPVLETEDPCPHEPKCTQSNLTVTKMKSLPRSYGEGDALTAAIYKMIKDYPWICFRGHPCVTAAWLKKTSIEIPGSTPKEMLSLGNLAELMTRESSETLGRDQLVYKLVCTTGVGLKMRQNGIGDYYRNLWQVQRLKLSFITAEGLITYLTKKSPRQKSWAKFIASFALAEEEYEDEGDEEYLEDFEEKFTSDGEIDEEDDEQYNQEKKRPPRVRKVISPNSREGVQNARVLEIFDRAAPLDAVRFRYLVEDLVRLYNHTYSLPMPFNAKRAQLEISKQKLDTLDATRPGFVSRVEPIDRKHTLLEEVVEEEEEEDVKEVECRRGFRIVSTYIDPTQTEESIFETRSKAATTSSRSRQTQAANRQKQQQLDNMLDRFKNSSRSSSSSSTAATADRGRKRTVSRPARSGDVAAASTRRTAPIMQPNVGKMPILTANQKQARLPSRGTTTIGFNKQKIKATKSDDTVKWLQPKKKQKVIRTSPTDVLKRVQAINQDTSLTEERKKELLAIEWNKFNKQ